MRGASRPQESSQTLLTRARQQRAQRARRRLENTSTIAIQTCVRSFLQRQFVLRELRGLFEGYTGVFDEWIVECGLFVASRGLLERFGINGGEEDGGRVGFKGVDVGGKVCEGVLGEGGRVVLRRVGVGRLGGVVGLLLGCCGEVVREGAGWEVVERIVEGVRRGLEVVEGLEGEVREEVVSVGIGRFGWFEELGGLVGGCGEWGVELSLRVLRLGLGVGGELGRRVGRLFVKWVLTVDGVGGLVKLERGELSRILEWYMEGEDWKPRDVDSAECLLGNVLVLTRDCWGGELTHDLWIAVKLVTGLVSAIPEFVNGDAQKDEDDSSEDEQMSSAKVKSVCETIAPLLEENNVSSLLMSATKEEGRESLNSLSKLFLVLTPLGGNQRTNLLNSLAFQPPDVPSVLPLLWRKCLSRGMATGTSQKTPRDRVDRNSAHILSLFSYAFAHKLYLQDEMENIVSDDTSASSSRDNNSQFTRKELVRLCQILKGGLCAAILDNSQGLTKGAIATAYVLRSTPGLLDQVAHLLSRLHFIDENNRFTSGSGFWPSRHPALKSRDFINSAVPVLSGDIQRANMRSYEVVVSDFLNKASFLIPFGTRATIFYALVDEERRLAANRRAENGSRPRRWITIRRNSVFEDALEKLWGRGDALKASIRVKFVDRLGTEEVGIDGGGVYKEFMTELLKQGFSPAKHGFFASTENNELYPARKQAIADPEGHLRVYRFLGQMLGKAVFDGVLVDLPFANFFLKKMIGKGLCFGDLKSRDSQVYKNLAMLKSLSAEEIESLGLDFTITDNDLGSVVEVPLVRGGKGKPVTKKNVIRYIHYVAFYRMHQSIKKISEQFLIGFREVVKLRWLKLFNEREVQLLISGKRESINIKDLKQFTVYSGGYSSESTVIKWFWTVVKSLDDERKKKLLRFVTSSERAPLLGFSYLHPSFCVHRASDEDGDHRLPTASTCMNLLKLPPYNSVEALKEKMIYALDSNAGFDLS